VGVVLAVVDRLCKEGEEGNGRGKRGEDSVVKVLNDGMEIP
jgi:hypothetical protein